MVAAYRPPRVPSVDEVGVWERAEKLSKRSIKKGSKIAGLQHVVSMMDLTTLEGKDTPGKIVSLCQKARRPLGNDGECPPVGAVCVYAPLVPVARRELEGSPVRVAAVASHFPSGQAPLEERVQDVKRAVDQGADEIDVVMNRNAFLAGEYAQVHDEFAQLKEACGKVHMKAILETGEIETFDKVRLAGQIAIDAGSDFIKTSTGKVQPSANMAVTLVMLHTIRDHYFHTGERIGMKPAGGIREAKEGLRYLATVKEVLGDAWLTPELFRFGASTLLNDVLQQLQKERLGYYQSGRYFSLP